MCEKFYNLNKGKDCLYKDTLKGVIAGFVPNYIIIGFEHTNGCIKDFSQHVTFIKGFKSYRFSKLKYIKIIS